MKSLLHVLHLEDNPNDAALVESAMEAEGIRCEITCVQDHDHFVSALERGGIDLILSDFSLPAFDGLSAAEIVRTRWSSIPLILVSGTLGEERAIDSFKSGATDYVLKERLARLAPAVRRAMQEVDERAEKKSLEAQFIEAQKMEVIGQLAGGVAHDFNNLLAVIIGYSDLILLDGALESRLRQFTSEIRQASERAAGLTRQLLIFSRKETVHSIVMDVNTVVSDMEQMLRSLIDENIEMSVALQKTPAYINADPGYVGQVLMNLVVNARDAMPGGGKLLITTSTVSLADADLLRREGAAPGNYVMLGVSDNGSGMGDEVKTRLFEPFFTTKPLGKGTGLGLSTCRTIVRHCHGVIDVESNVDRGTAFRIYFPNVEQPENIIPRADPEAPLPRGTETILVVEDEPSVRQLARVVLEAQGYEVISAADGQEALLIARLHQGSQVKLVITDMIMPRMGGKITAEWLKAAYPDLKVLFTSGYTDDNLPPHGEAGGDVEFLPKPYTPALLVRTVRALLDKKTGTEKGQALPGFPAGACSG